MTRAIACYLFLTLAALGIGSAECLAQTGGLRLQRVDTTGAEVTYVYNVVGILAERKGLADVDIDVATPKGKSPPVITGVEGSFLMDALKLRFDDFAVSHAPLFIDTPDQWFASIGSEGMLSWRLDTDNFPKAAGVMPGRSSKPFILKSPALPAFRRWTISARAPLPDVEEESFYIPGDGDTKPARKRTETPSYHGYVIGPGWMPKEVTVRYLVDQTRAACSAKLLETEPCESLRNLARDLLDAEAAKRDERYLDLLSRAKAAVAKSKNGMSTLVFQRTITALAARPPSARQSI
jgi:hypothetical protein